jgi:16S rRNA (guanine966-N2)-methyltransferase
VPDAARVITGSAGGLRLEVPGPSTRALSARVKGALFSLVEAERADVWEHPVLDLFAGSGAAGIEALSRGAPAALLVERDARAAACIARNLERTGLAASARVLRRDVVAFLGGPVDDAPEGPFGFVMVDPPYDRPADLDATLKRLADPAAGWLDGAAVVAAKHFWKSSPPDASGVLRRTRERRFGETALSVYRRVPQPAVGGS